MYVLEARDKSAWGNTGMSFDEFEDMAFEEMDARRRWKDEQYDQDN